MIFIKKAQSLFLNSKINVELQSCHEASTDGK